jgi:hypothetical protein
MNREAEQHLTKAGDYVARGEEFYRKAAEEIIAAKEADSTLSNYEIARQLDRDEYWVRKMIDYAGNARALPFEGRAEQNRVAATKKLLREAPPEEVARIIESDPQIATNVAKAAQRVEQASVERVRREQRERTPELVHRAGFNEVAGDLLRLKRTYALALDKARELDLEADEAEALDEQVDGIGAITDWFHSFLRSGSRGFEQDLANLLADEGR